MPRAADPMELDHEQASSAAESRRPSGEKSLKFWVLNKSWGHF